MTDGRLSLTDIAVRAEVRLSAVSNWRTRHSDFPRPHLVAGQEMFDVGEVAQWLRERRIPRNRLKPDEPPGTSYGDRFLGNASGSPGPAVVEAEESPQPVSWSSRLWSAMDQLRGTHDVSSALEFLIGLIYVRAERPDVWQTVVSAGQWSQMRNALAGVSLRTAAGVAVPVFKELGHTADRALTKAIELIGEIELGDRGPESTGAQAGTAVLAELERSMGRSSGEFTPPDVARCLVELLDPKQTDVVYDPFCGSGELLSAAAAHVVSRGGSLNGWQAYGQPSHDWSWQTSTMNLALHGVEAKIGVPANALKEDRFPDRRFTRILANPAFNLHVDLAGNRTWPFGEPPAHNANFAWLQYAVTKLAPGGRAVVLMPVGASFGRSKEAAIREAMVEAGVVECLIALPPQLFRFTGIPTMIWVLRDGDTEPVTPEVLFIDAREAGELVDRARRRLGDDTIGRIVGEYQRWSTDREFDGVPGFSRVAGLEEIRRNDFDLTPGRYTSPIAEQVDVARIAADLGSLRDELNALKAQADLAHVDGQARLDAVIADRHPENHGAAVQLGEVCDVLPGPGTLPRSGHQETWTPLVLPRNIRDNRIGTDGLDVVPPDTAQRLARYRLNAGDVVSARVGTLGRYGRMLDHQTGWLLGPGCVRFRPGARLDPDFLTYYLGSPAGLRWLMENAIGSAIQQVNAATLRRMPLWLPSLAEQRAIVEVVEPFQAASALHAQISAVEQKIRDLLLPVLMSPPASFGR